MAAPVVGSMMADILPYMGVEAETDAERGEAVMPMAVGQSLHGAAELIKGTRDSGTAREATGATPLARQLPAAGSAIAEGSEIILYLDAEISQDTGEQRPTSPG